jgi:hypothetical protein
MGDRAPLVQDGERPVDQQIPADPANPVHLPVDELLLRVDHQVVDVDRRVERGEGGPAGHLLLVDLGMLAVDPGERAEPLRADPVDAGRLAVEPADLREALVVVLAVPLDEPVAVPAHREDLEDRVGRGDDVHEVTVDLRQRGGGRIGVLLDHGIKSLDRHRRRGPRTDPGGWDVGGLSRSGWGRGGSADAGQFTLSTPSATVPDQSRPSCPAAAASRPTSSFVSKIPEKYAGAVG